MYLNLTDRELQLVKEALDYQIGDLEGTSAEPLLGEIRELLTRVEIVYNTRPASQEELNTISRQRGQEIPE